VFPDESLEFEYPGLSTTCAGFVDSGVPGYQKVAQIILEADFHITKIQPTVQSPQKC
jgi:hypothetical protein